MPDSTHPSGQWLPTEAWFRIATRAASIGVWEWDLETGAMRYSSVARSIFGFQPDEPISIEKVRATTHPEDHPWTSARARRAVDPAIRERPKYDYRIRRYDTGEVRWISARGEAMFANVGGEERAIRYVGTVQDVTEQKDVADRLAASEARLRLAIEAADLAVWEVDPQRDVIVGSPELNRLCGFPDDAQPTLEDFKARYAPGERERIEAEAAAIRVQGEKQMQAEVKLLLPGGVPRWLLMRAREVPGPAPEEIRAVGVVMDVTTQKLQEERLETVAREMRHRVKNLIAIIGAIATRSLRDSQDTAAGLASLGGRLKALSVATDMILTRGQEETELRILVEAIIEPFRLCGADVFVLCGDGSAVPPRAIQGIAMALHELCTNAVKYGALSVPEGRIEVAWRARGGVIELCWRETGGPPVAPGRSGYGSQLLAGLFASPDELALELKPEGAECRIRVVADTGP